MVATILASAFTHDPLTFRSVLPAAIIFGSVIVITTEAGMRRRATAAAGRPELEQRQ